MNNNKQSSVEFNPYHAQMDYETNVVDVQYNGEFDEDKAIEYAKQSYPNINGRIVYHSKPNIFNGYENLGIIGIK